MIRLIIAASALSLAAAKTPKSTKVILSPTPPPAPLAKSVKSAKTYASVSMSTSMSLTTKSAKLTTKLSKSSKSGTNFIASFGCHGECISAQEVELSTDKLENAVKTCASDEDQTWNVHEVGGFFRIESAAHNDGGMCLAIIDDDCDGGELGLAHCDSPESTWYFDGGNLLSYYCWDAEGKSTAMSADGCSNLSAKDPGSSGVLTIFEEFMFLKAGD